MRYVGVDPSLSRTGVCVLEGESVSFFSLKSSSKEAIFKRQLSLVTQFQELLQAGDVVVFEDFGISSRFAPSGRFVERIELCGMLKFVSPMISRLPWMSVPPNMLKMFVAGKASAKKDEIVRCVSRKWQVDPRNDDEADAFGLAALGRSVLSGAGINDKLAIKFRAYGENVTAERKIRFLQNA